jgi:hypothetical protein
MDRPRSPLRERLALLRQPGGQLEAASAAAAVAVPVAERMARLRPDRPPETHRPGDDALAALLGGSCLAPGLIVRERLVPRDHRHGHYPVYEVGALEAPDSRFAGLREGDVLLDTETTGLAGGTGTLVFLLGVARVEPEGLRVCQWFLTGFGGEPHLLEAARGWLGRSERLLTFNGKSFDAPLLAARFRLAGAADPLAGLRHEDLLYPVRRAFARRWPDCRLQTAEERLLGFRRQGDLPSWEIPGVWFDWVRRGNTRFLPALLAHNYWDLLSLAALLPALAAAYGGVGRVTADRAAIARGYVRDGKPERAFAQLRSCADDLDVPGRLLLARLHRGRGEWEAALALWEPLAAQGSVEAVLCLAKYHEHRSGDFSAALVQARRLVELEPRQPAHRFRVCRLERKLGQVQPARGLEGGPPS